MLPSSDAQYNLDCKTICFSKKCYSFLLACALLQAIEAALPFLCWLQPHGKMLLVYTAHEAASMPSAPHRQVSIAAEPGKAGLQPLFSAQMLWKTDNYPQHSCEYTYLVGSVNLNSMRVKRMNDEWIKTCCLAGCFGGQDAKKGHALIGLCSGVGCSAECGESLHACGQYCSKHLLVGSWLVACAYVCV